MSDKAIPLCQAACPINTDVPGYVSAISRGDLERAIRIIRQVNPFPSVCGRICTRPCESACRRAQIDEPIAIAALKRFASDQTKGLKVVQPPEHFYNETHMPTKVGTKENENNPPSPPFSKGGMGGFPGEKVAVVGSGPAGLTAAHDLTLLGYRVTVFEAQNILGGMLIEGIPEYRLPKDVVKEEIDYILSLGIEAKRGLSLGRDFTIEGLLKDYQAVFLAIGSQKSLLPRCNEVELTGIITAVEFLKQVSQGERPLLGKRVVIVGGGHTAIDAARTCVRLGSSEVTIIYRRTLDEMPAGKAEVEETENEGVKIRYLTAPVEFLGNGNVKKVRCIKMQLGELDESGRRRPLPIENSEFEIEADTVILAIGYIPEAETIKDSGLILGKNGTVVVKDDTGATNLKGVFAGGDVVSGPSSVIEAIASGKKAARAIHRYLRNLPDEKMEEYSAFRLLDDGIVKLISKSNMQKVSTLPIEKRINSFAEVELGYNFEQAVKEAQRCLSCGTGAVVTENCASCLNCVRICPYGVPVPGREIAEIDISQCQACGICVSECPASAINLKLETKEQVRAEMEDIINIAMKEAQEILTIGFYCQYKSPAGHPGGGNGVYWLGKLCTGRLDVFQLIYPFELGADGLVITVCPDQECHSRDGSRWLIKHIEKAREILDEIGIGANRLSIISDVEELSDFRKRLLDVGINPLRKGKKVKE
ncbi:MAG: FAD-dependent oxidoreductase [Thermodesulfovibrionales bacterium]|nr:FAD-dependent oxidoreductase [Nitrospinota bacterium]MCG2709519.1 FAD-dependent oxidoreductase [Thermodesulfovibrionales bacterium]